MKGRGKPPGRGGPGKRPAGPGKRPAGSGAARPRPPSRGADARDGAPDRPVRSRPAAGAPTSRGQGSREDTVRKAPLHAGRPRRGAPAAAGRERQPERDEGFRSFDEAPRRRRDSDWDIEGGERPWQADAELEDLDLDALDDETGDDQAGDDEGLDEPRPDPRGRGDAEAAPSRRPAARQPASSRRPVPQAGPTRAELKAAATATFQSGVQTLAVTADEDDMRVDRFLAARFPQLSFSYIQRIVRKGELRVNGRRVETKDRLEAGQAVRVPPLKLDQPRPVANRAQDDVLAFLASITLYEDADVLVLAKPAGLAVQGGSGMKKHVDGMLAALTDKDGQRPRLVHRLDKDTSGCLLVAKSRFAAAALAKTFRSRAARKIYWAVVAGVPKPRQGRVSTYLAKDERADESVMRIARHGEKGATHAVSYYAVIDTMAQKLAWLSMKPVTGRTHQLRVHAAEIGYPIIGDPKYFDVENWDLPGGIQKKLHLHARRIVVPHPRGKGTIDISAPLPAHMEQTFNLLGWDASRYDPIVEAPEE
ncbi:RluA family pseudouridine synthase [Phreatobacter sp.]|uniref:RluA family pseudouridine synthase n=1 Tax=Phreatobacter sp. TaxID=1966341 RepID=UPI003F71F587